VRGQIAEGLDGLERRRATVAGEVGNEHAAGAREERRQLGEVDGRAGQPMDEDERRSLASEPVARPDAGDLRNMRPEPSKERCRAHPGYRIL
jgi:hypothetical protein